MLAFPKIKVSFNESQACLHGQGKAPLYAVDMSFKDRLKAARKALGLRQLDVAEKLGVSVQAVSQWERGENEPEFHRALKLSEMLGIDLINGETENKDGTYPQEFTPMVAPLLSRVAAGQWAEIMASGERPPVDRYFEVSEKPVGAVFSLEIESGSMEPEFKAGDIIVIDSGIEPLPGDFVVAKLDNEDRATFKKYRPRGQDEDGKPVIELAPLNPDYPSLFISARTPGRIIGVMVEHRRFRARRSR